MAVFRLNLVTEEEFIKSLGEDLVAVVSGTRATLEERQYQNVVFNYETQPETELEMCSCPIGGMMSWWNWWWGIKHEQPTSSENVHLQSVPDQLALETQSSSVTPKKRDSSTEMTFFDKVLASTTESVNGFKVVEVKLRDINQGLTPALEPSKDINGKSSQTDLPRSKKKHSWGSFAKMSIANQIKIISAKALFPAGTSEVSFDGTEKYENELDSEWLSEYSGTESSTDYNEEARKIRDKDKLFAFFAKIPVEPQSWRMQRKLGPLFGLMTCLGINPYTTFIRKKMYNYKIEPFSLRYIIFFMILLITSAITGISWANFLIMFSSVPEGLPFPRYTEYLELEKYWPIAFFHLLSLATVTARGAIIYLRNGKRSVEFMNRWHLAVVGVKYDPYEDVAGKIQLNIGYAAVYSLIIIILYTSGFTVVRDACGLFGILLCRSFTPTIRTGGHYEVVRLVGLFMHIYITFAERLITTYILVYCKFLENFAQNWNIRMAHTLGMFEQFEELESRTPRLVSKIPFSKLYAEHLILTTFAKLTGKIFNVNFILFFLVKFADISFLAYRVITFMTVPGELNSERFEEEFLEGIYADRDDRVRFQDPVHYQFLCSFIIFFITLLGWFLTTLDIIEPGRAIQSSFGFVRRWGFMQCTSCAMKRFIMSLNFKLSNPGGYYFSPGFTINRKFVTYSAVWTIFFILQILAFNPYKVTSIAVDICTRDPATGIETCYTFHPPPDHSLAGINRSSYEFGRDIVLGKDVAGGPGTVPTSHVPSQNTSTTPTTTMPSTSTTTTTKPTTTTTTTTKPTTTTTTTTKPTTTTTTTTRPTTTTTPGPQPCYSSLDQSCFGMGEKRAVVVFYVTTTGHISSSYAVRVVCCYEKCIYGSQDVCKNEDEKGIVEVTKGQYKLAKRCLGSYSERHFFYIYWAAKDGCDRSGLSNMYLYFEEVRKEADKNKPLCQEELSLNKLQPNQQQMNYGNDFRSWENYFTKPGMGDKTRPTVNDLNVFGSYNSSDKGKLKEEWMKFSNCVC